MENSKKGPFSLRPSRRGSVNDNGVATGGLLLRTTAI